MRFAVWAPHAQSSVALLLDGQRLEMTPGHDGWWQLDEEASEGSRYAFSLDGSDARTDPRALRLPDGPEGEAEVVDLGAVDWSDTGWRGAQLPGAVVYEMHVGTFTPEGTLDSAVGRLDHLVSLGVGMVELMPLATFPGRYGWGYDGVGLYAVHEPYGGPQALCRFVDACHQRGLGVFLDVVYNHLGPSGNHLSEFGPYFTDRYGTPWGPALNLDDGDSDEVRRFVIDNALMWLRDFHVDGLRLDAVHALFDDRAVTMLEEMSSEVAALSTGLGRSMWLIAESDRNDPLTVTPREAGGLGLHAQWSTTSTTPCTCCSRVRPRATTPTSPRPQPWRRCSRASSSTTGSTRRFAVVRTDGPSTEPELPGGGSWPPCRPMTRSATGQWVTGCRRSCPRGCWPVALRC